MRSRHSGILPSMFALTASGLPMKIAALENDAGIAQLVERNLAKVEVASSSLVSRSSF
jgi:hypothetical protein